ncbi:hypothetical protein ACCT18_01285 [Rhizobium ruizarguesonis]
MGVIRWEDYRDGELVGFLGKDHVCTINVTKVGTLTCWTIEVEYRFPGGHAAEFRDTKIPTFSEEDAKRIADQLLQDWMDDVGLMPKVAVRTEADFRNAGIDHNFYVTFRDGGVA